MKPKLNYLIIIHLIFNAPSPIETLTKSQGRDLAIFLLPWKNFILKYFFLLESVRTVLDSPIDWDLLLVSKGFFFQGGLSEFALAFFPALYKFDTLALTKCSSPFRTLTSFHQSWFSVRECECVRVCVYACRNHGRVKTEVLKQMASWPYFLAKTKIMIPFLLSTRTLSLSHTLTHSLSHTHTHTLSLSHTHFHTLQCDRQLFEAG